MFPGPKKFVLSVVDVDDLLYFFFTRLLLQVETEMNFKLLVENCTCFALV